MTMFGLFQDECDEHDYSLDETSDSYKSAHLLDDCIVIKEKRTEKYVCDECGDEKTEYATLKKMTFAPVDVQYFD